MGRADGMMTMEQSLTDLVKAGRITRDAAHARLPHRRPAEVFGVDTIAFRARQLRLGLSGFLAPLPKALMNCLDPGLRLKELPLAHGECLKTLISDSGRTYAAHATLGHDRSRGLKSPRKRRP
jgi:hypothetical protein